MSEPKIYKTDLLYDISQIDAGLALKKTGGEEELFGLVSAYVDFAGVFMGKYNNGGIIESYKDFLADADTLKERAGVLYAQTIVWDADALIDTFKNGNKDTILEKYEALRMSAEALLKRLKRTECDETGALVIPAREKVDFEGDEELMSQPECGRTITGNLVPQEKIGKIAKLVEDLDFDEALRLARLLGSVYYGEAVNLEIKKLIWLMKMGDFERAAASAQKIIEESQKHNEEVEQSSEKKLPRLLVVDDVVDVLLSIKGILIDMCHVCTVTNYVSALRFLENCHADIIMLDIGLPEVDGFALLKKIREINKYKETPVMFLTGDVSKGTIVKAIDSGVSDYLSKPFDASTLISRVHRLMKMIGWQE